ncbi:DUF4041 domain-containing protein [Hominenteromicrobium sp.]|uniref:DUF4041 domain-containing protein n=1 Tax=Hominenteromicrobium sp. TaxID=3073581 RepID=UPI003A931338
MARCLRCGKSGLFVKVNFQGLCENCQRAQLAEMQAVMTPEQNTVLNLQEQIRQFTAQRDHLAQEVRGLQSTTAQLNNEIQIKRQQIYDLDEAVMLQDFGLYQPKYEMKNSEAYKERLTSIRQQQKDLVKTGNAVTGNSNWMVNGSKAQGNKMVKDMQKLLLRSFNSDCDSVIEKVKYNNYDSAFKRITASANAITKLGSIMNVAITTKYYQLKCEELSLALEYQIKKQEEKEAQKAARAQMREEAKLAKEIEEARRKAEKERTHYQNALTAIDAQIQTASGEHLEELKARRAELQTSLSEAEHIISDIDYREANQKAGYVYVISNIGSFGENVYKIGMTRRLDPMERIDELGDASVPFDFDVHAMIFSDNAPALEAALHRAFENRKVNMVNTRREFFNVTLDEIKAVVKANYDKTAEFIDVADAEQYRRSLKMKSSSSEQQ